MTSGGTAVEQPVTDVQLLERWRRWLDGICNDICWIHTDRFYWREVSKMVQRNPEIPGPGPIMRWMLRLFVNNLAMGIRRQADHRDDVVTLGRLLRSIVDNPTCASRKQFIARYEDGPLEQEMANRHFDQFTDPGGDHVAVRVVEADISRLETETARVIEYATKHGAHLDRKYAYPEGLQPSDFPNLDEMDKALDAVGELLKRYYLLLTSNCLLSPEPVPQFNWQQAFSVAWCPPDEDEDGDPAGGPPE
jgi:hypothetical protein